MNTSKIQEMTQKIADLKTQMQEEGKLVLKEGFKEFFDKYPLVECVTWTQYTPYFNDGESCEFGVNDFAVLTKEGLAKAEEDDDFDEHNILVKDYDAKPAEGQPPFTWETRPYKNIPGFTNEDLDQIRLDVNALHTIPDEVFLELFGDHVEVKASRAGFDIEEHEHD